MSSVPSFSPMLFSPPRHPLFEDPNAPAPQPPDPNPPEADAPSEYPSEAETSGETLTGDVMGQPAKSAKDLAPEAQRKLLELAKKTIDSYSVARMGLVKTVQEGRNFWKGLQNLKWNKNTQRFDPATTPLGDTKDAQEEIEPTSINIYQADGLSLVSALSATAPHGVFTPEDGENPDDIASAKAASKIVKRFERVNQIENILSDEIRYAWTDSYYGLFVRYKVDGDRFGWRETPVMDQQAKTIPGPDGDTTTSVPVSRGVIRKPNGEEVVDVIGTLELSIPPYGRSQYDYPAIEWQTETPVSLLRAIYKDRIKELNEGGDAGSGTANATERNARLMLTNAPPGYDGRFGNSSSPDLVTYKRTWIRHWAFYAIEEEATRDKLLALFPDGAYVAHANEILLDARNECMDDHWTIVHPLPSDGAYGEPVGGSTVPIQRAVNNLVDRQLQNDAFGVPPTFYDSSIIDGDAYADTTIKPAQLTPVKLPPGKSMANVMYSPPPSQLSPSSTELRNFLMALTARLNGVQPAMYGGEETGAGGSTSSGYAMAADHAMQRSGLVYRALKMAHARMNENLLKIMAKERKENIFIPTKSDDGSFKNDVIALTDLKGRVKVSAEDHEDVPVTWAQQKNALQGLFTSTSPALQAIASDPANIALAARSQALEDLHIPGEDAQNEQDEETSLLITQQPIQQTDSITGAPLTDPMTGQPYPPQTSVPINPLDNHPIHLARWQQFKESEEGRKLKRENPAGFQNGMLHAFAHQAAMQPAAPPPAPAQGPAPHTPMEVANG